MAWPVIFLERYHKGGDEFLSHIVPLTGYGTWILFVNAEFKAMDAHTFTRQAEKV
jgi:hypothetical protein